jgi:hypothetical protein
MTTAATCRCGDANRRFCETTALLESALLKNLQKKRKKKKNKINSTRYIYVINTASVLMVFGGERNIFKCIPKKGYSYGVRGIIWNNCTCKRVFESLKPLVCKTRGRGVLELRIFFPSSSSATTSSPRDIKMSTTHCTLYVLSPTESTPL